MIIIEVTNQPARFRVLLGSLEKKAPTLDSNPT